MKNLVLICGLAVLLLVPGAVRAEEGEGWVSMFDGESLKGWKVNENPDSFKVENGVIVVKGQRAHAFYEGGPYTDFEFKADILTKPGANSGIFFHTQFQESGWPAQGYEVQVNNTQGDPVKTGSLYNTVKLFESAAEDNKWWTQKITVRGKHVTVEVNGKQVIDYTEPEGKEGPAKLGSGTIALQAHDPGSEVHYKNLSIRPLK